MRSSLERADQDHEIPLGGKPPSLQNGHPMTPESTSAADTRNNSDATETTPLSDAEAAPQPDIHSLECDL